MTHRDGFPRFSASTRVVRRCKGIASHALRRPPIGPTDRLPDLYGSLSTLLGISGSCAGGVASSGVRCSQIFLPFLFPPEDFLER